MDMRRGESWNEFLLRCALRHDTAMSRAMLRALGLPARDPMPEGTVVAKVDRYRDVRECFENKRRVRL